jgi:UDP-N-acetylglucosamine--N-acetylmuramyl-(pentapeptide) pyrophosphoryl-undecaprenol N-acetylglucosamine transferase
MREHCPEVALTFVDSVADFARPMVEKADLPFEHYDSVRSGPLHGVSLLKALNSLVQLTIGTAQAIALMRKRQPNVLLLTGGWVGLPIALAGRVWRIPSLIYLPDIEPGLTIKVLKFIVNKVAVTAQESQPYFRRDQMVVTGYPLRRSLLKAAQGDGRTRATAHFKLDPTRKTVFVTGGSRGARSINNAVLELLPELLKLPVQVIHVTGTLDWEDISARRAALEAQYPETMAHYHAFAYLHDDMALGLAAADLVLSRAGASVLGENPLFGSAAILVPYPHAWRYQKVNADYLAERGTAVVMRDDAMAVELLPTLRELLFEKPEKLASMRKNAAALGKTSADGASGDETVTDSAWNVARELLRLAGDRA